RERAARDTRLDRRRHLHGRDRRPGAAAVAKPGPGARPESRRPTAARRALRGILRAPRGVAPRAARRLALGALPRPRRRGGGLGPLFRRPCRGPPQAPPRGEPEQDGGGRARRARRGGPDRPTLPAYLLI